MAVHPEAYLISALVRTGEYQQLAAQGVSAAMFHVHQEEMEWVERYISRSSRTPSKAALKQQFPEFVIFKVDDTGHWCEEVKKEHKRQSLVDLADEMLSLVESEDEDKALEIVARGLSSIHATSGGMNSDFDLLEDWEAVYQDVSAKVDRARTTGWAGIPTGFPTLDHLTGGLQAGWFVVYAARLSGGKTQTALRSAWEAYRSGYKVMYFSLEQSRFQIATRVHAFASRQFGKAVFNPLDLNKGIGFDLREYKKFLEAFRKNKGAGSFIINDTSRGKITPPSISAAIEAKQPDIVFVDYLGLMMPRTEAWQGAANLSGDVQAIPQRYGIPLVGLSQINRGGAGRTPPTADNLSQTDALGQDADVVVTMARQSARVQRFRLAKFRHGPDNEMWDAFYSPGTGEYEEIDAQRAQDIIEEDQEVD